MFCRHNVSYVLLNISAWMLPTSGYHVRSSHTCSSGLASCETTADDLLSRAF